MQDRADPLRTRVLAELRHRNLSARKASIGAGLGAATLGNFLAGRSGVESETARKIARYFGWAEDDALELAGHKSSGVQAAPTDNALQLLRDALRRGNLPEGFQRAMFDLAAEGIQLARTQQPPPETDDALLARAEAAWEYAIESMAAFEGERVSDSQRLARIKQRFFRRMWGDLRPDPDKPAT